MLIRSRFSIIIILLFFSFSLFSQAYKVRIGFIGNSITIGSGLSNPTVECYPSQLGLLLKEKYGDTCVVTNYAVSGRTMLKKGDFPWWNEPDFKKCWNYAPDICFIMLGTNDSKPYNWDVYGADFFQDYQALVDTFKVRNPATKFIVCRPPPAFAVVYDIRNPVIIDQIIPLVDSIAKVNSADVVDFYHSLIDSVYLFPDKIHPNAKGAKVLAKIAFDEIVSSGIIHKIETGKTFVTSLSSNVPGDLRILDKATISWTTINASEIFLNGQTVNASGSLQVIPTETTSYKLVAKGETSSDSLTLVQNVYIPRLAKFTVTAPIRTMTLGTKSTLKLNFYDQNNKVITDSVFVPVWSITQGSGHFANEVNNSIDVIGDVIGTLKVQCTIGTITTSMSFTIKDYPTSINPANDEVELSVYPNPFNRQLFISIPVEKPGKLVTKFFDSDGRLCKTDSRQLKETGNPSIELNTSGLPAGFYFINMEISGKNYSGKIMKE